MQVLFLALLILSSLFMIVLVLMQSGKGGGLSGAFGSAGGESSFFGANTATVIMKATAVMAGIFMVSCIVLAMMYRGGTAPPLETDFDISEGVSEVIGVSPDDTTPDGDDTEGPGDDSEDGETPGAEEDGDAGDADPETDDDEGDSGNGSDETDEDDTGADDTEAAPGEEEENGETEAAPAEGDEDGGTDEGDKPNEIEKEEENEGNE